MNAKEIEEYSKPNGRKVAAHFMELLQTGVFFYEGYGHFGNGNIYWCYALNGIVGLVLGWIYFRIAHFFSIRSVKEFAGVIFTSTDIKNNKSGFVELLALFAWIPLGLYFDSYGVLIPYITFNYALYFLKKKFIEEIKKEKNWGIKKEVVGYSIVGNGLILCSIGERMEIKAAISHRN